MKRILPILFALWLFGCGDIPRFDSESVPEVKAYIHFIPESGYGTSALFFASVRSKTIEQGSSGNLVAELRIGGESISNDNASEFIRNFIWEFRGARTNASSVTQSFPDSGIFDAVLHTVDFFGDTLNDTMSFYVSAPLSIRASSPEEDFSVDPFDSAGVLFTVETSGINSWQDVRCTLYVSPQKDSIWQKPFSEVPCNGEFRIKGPIAAGDSNLFTDTSYSLHWALKALDTLSEMPFDRDSTAVMTLSTKLVGTELSDLTVPVRYRFLPSDKTPEGIVLLQDASGDTLAVETYSKNPARVHFKGIEADRELTVTVLEKRLTEYTPVSKAVFLKKSTHTLLDTLLLGDTVPPIRIPAKAKVSRSDSIRFYLYDGGSGVSATSLSVILESDTLDYKVSGDVLSFPASCSKACRLSVSLRDFSGNAALPVHWKLSEDGDSLKIEGPFNPEGK